MIALIGSYIHRSDYQDDLMMLMVRNVSAPYLVHHCDISRTWSTQQLLMTFKELPEGKGPTL